MERGPYDRPPPPEDPRYPQRDPAYRDPAYDPAVPPEPERRIGVGDVVAIIALVVAIVAIFLAIDARNEGSSDEEIARQVRQETQRQIDQIRSSTGEQTGSADKRAREAENEAEETGESVTELSNQVSSLNEQVTKLQSQQNEIRSSLQKQGEAISDIRRTLREE